MVVKYNIGKGRYLYFETIGYKNVTTKNEQLEREKRL